MVDRPRLSVSTAGLLLGPVSFALLLGFEPLGLVGRENAAVAVTSWVVLWWVTEAAPIPVTSLLPFVLFPAAGVVDVSTAAAPYADPVVFLLLGGFLLALTVERWNLHHRLSLHVIHKVGTSASMLVLGFMLATAFLSMWISNTATAMMMVPIGAAVIVEVSAVSGRRKPPLSREDIEEPNAVDDVESELVHPVDEDPDALPNTSFGLALMLGIAYGASVGGAATLIGSPPNAVLAGVASDSLGVSIGFLEWMLVGVPLAVVFLAVTWLTLVFVLKPRVDRLPGRDDVVRMQLEELGGMTTGERRALAVFAFVAAAWVLRPFAIEPFFPQVTDAMIAVAGGVLVFLVPVDDTRLLTWEYSSRLPWGVLLLLGAGFSIARAFRETGVDDSIAEAIAALGVTEAAWMVLLVTSTVIVLTNVTSNTATAALFMPIAASVAVAVGLPPLTLMAAAAFAASYAFVLPVATAPNAIVFGTGYMTIPEMAKIGLLLTAPAVLAISAFALYWIPLVWS